MAPFMVAPLLCASKLLANAIGEIANRLLRLNDLSCVPDYTDRYPLISRRSSAFGAHKTGLPRPLGIRPSRIAPSAISALQTDL